MSKITQPIILLKTTVQNIQSNPILLYPTLILGLSQFLVLEILYFAPRRPLSNFFGPLISHVWSEEFLHYPMDLILLPKLFYYAQIFVYIFGGAFLLAVTTHLVSTLNNNHRANLKNSFKEAGRHYIQIFLASLLSLFLFQVVSTFYTFATNSILRIKTSNEMLAGLQKMLLLATPYFQFLIGILVTTLLIYVVPILIIEKKSILKAVRLNLAVLFKTFNLSLLVVLIPTLFYLPILVARNNIESLVNVTVPEIQVFIIVLGILVTLAIDLVVLTTVTTHYLFLKEDTVS
jgi:hypothetical protein